MLPLKYQAGFDFASVLGKMLSVYTCILLPTDDTGHITLDQRYAYADAWCEWALTQHIHATENTKHTEMPVPSSPLSYSLVAVGAAAQKALGGRGAAEVTRGSATSSAPYRETGVAARVEHTAAATLTREGANRIVARALPTGGARAFVVV